jgi:hypothetical protein
MTWAFVKRATIVPMATVMLATAASAAFAQGGPGMMGGDRGDRWGGMGWHMWGRGGDRWGAGPDGMLDRVDGRLAFLKTELKITEAQSTAWSKVASAIRDSAKSRNERMKAIWSDHDKAKSLLERLELHEKFMTVRLDEVKQLKGAWADLYGQLSEDQKKEADGLVIPMMGMGMGMGGPGMGWRAR